MRPRWTRLRWQWQVPRSTSWGVDETYVKVRGKWAYLYRALDKHGNTIDCHLSPMRNTAAAKRFLGKADIRGEARIVERAFGLGASALAEVVQLFGSRLEPEAA